MIRYVGAGVILSPGSLTREQKASALGKTSIEALQCNPKWVRDGRGSEGEALAAES